MSGIIPEDEEEEQEVYDDVGNMDEGDQPVAIDEDIYEELPGLNTQFDWDNLYNFSPLHLKASSSCLVKSFSSFH